MAYRYLLAVLLTVFVFMVTSAQVQLNERLPNFQKHYVRERETPSSIAHDFNIKTKDFLMLNNFPADVKLKPGQEVLIKVLREGESAPKEAVYVPNKSSEVRVAESEPVTEKKEPVMEEKEPVEEKKEPVVEKRKEPVVEKAERETTKPKKEPVVERNVEPEMLVGPNGAKYEMTSGNFHVVQKGQTFYHIALMYHLSIDELKKINHLTTTDIKVGQELKVSR